MKKDDNTQQNQQATRTNAPANFRFFSLQNMNYHICQLPGSLQTPPAPTLSASLRLPMLETNIDDNSQTPSSGNFRN